MWHEAEKHFETRKVRLFHKPIIPLCKLSATEKFNANLLYSLSVPADMSFKTLKSELCSWYICPSSPLVPPLSLLLVYHLHIHSQTWFPQFKSNFVGSLFTN